MKLLRLVLNISETSGAYYLFALPMLNKVDQTLVCYFKPNFSFNTKLRVIHGNNLMRSYLKIIFNKLIKGSYNIIHAHSPHVGILLLIVYLIIPKQKRIPKVFSVHYSFGHLSFRNKLLLIPIFILFDKIIFCGRASLNSFPSVYKYLIKNKCEVIYNGVNTKGISINRNNANVIKETFDIIVVSRLEKFKNVDKIIDAITTINDKNITLRIAGDGSYRHCLETKIIESPFKSNIIILGEIARHEVISNLVSSDLYISMSSSEGFPVSVLESLVCECPVVLSNIEPHLDLADGKDFINIVDIDNLDELIEIILKFKNMDQTKLYQIRNKCNEFVKNKYSGSTMQKKYINIYKTFYNVGNTG
ncbi:MAG: glycosyltransferase family 4 protein [Gammaproteobacteria bacterium]|jgi:glycosyltransferase involved in cell wall biosynthesis|nr:glycosyltransferase family 4 protein [Gammaproteobacteria bacterium]